MNKNRLKNVIKEEIRKIQKMNLMEVEIPCCNHGAGFNATCCGDARRDCCKIDNKYGMGMSGCCEKFIPGGGTPRFVRREM